MATEISARESVSPSYFPISVNLKGKRLLVVGGGKKALMEIERMLDFGAGVDVVAQHVLAEIQDLAKTRGAQLEVLQHKFGASELSRLQAGLYLFLIAADSRAAENDAALKAAREARVLSFDCTSMTTSDFTMPAVFKRGHLKVSVSTDGISPVLEQAILSNLEAALSPELDKDAIFLNSLAEDFAQLNGESVEAETKRRAIYLELAMREDLRYALQRRNFSEARKIVDRIFSETGLTEENTQRA
jgi:precorrin-2 dehydrogenase / sirohydrochlorin ferrochelatase